MGVEGGTSSLCPRVVAAEQFPKFLAGGGVPAVVLVEYLRDGTPAGPAGEGQLFVGVGPAVLVTARCERAQRCEVGVELGSLARWGEVALPCRPEGRPGRRRFPGGYEVWIVWLIDARSAKYRSRSGSASSGFVASSVSGSKR